MIKNKTIKKIYKRISILVISSLVSMTFSSYAATSKYDPIFPDAPIDEEGHGESRSEGLIYSPLLGVGQKNPLNPTPSIIDEKEKLMYDTYVIDINTIPKRVEYFSPTYQKILNTAQTTILGTMAMMGVTPDASDELRHSVEDYRDNRKTIINTLSAANKVLKELSKKSVLTPEEMTKKVIAEGTVLEATNLKSTVEMAIRMTKSGEISMNRALSTVRRVGQVANINIYKDTIAQSLALGYLQYKQLEYYETVLKRLVELNNRKYDLTIKNIELGLATENDLIGAKLDRDTAIDNYNSICTVKDNAERQILTNLGYKIEDKNMIEYKEPEINFEVILSIDPTKDYEHAYHSNQQYLSIQNEVQGSKNRGDDYSAGIYNKYKDEYKQMIINNLDSLYADLMAAYVSYEGSLSLKEAYEIEVASAKVKKDQGLVSDIEAIGLDAQNLSTEMSIASAKYNLISAYYNYYYGTYGIGTL